MLFYPYVFVNEFPLQVYTTLLAVRTIFSTPFWRDLYSRQLFLLLLAEFAAFFYLNIWPLCTVGGYPYDFPERATFRPRAVALTVSGVIIPLFIPRPFRSSTKKVSYFFCLGRCHWSINAWYNDYSQPGAEDTASLISLYTFSFVQSILFFAYKAKQVSIDELPQLSDKRTAESLDRKVSKVKPSYASRCFVTSPFYFNSTLTRYW